MWGAKQDINLSIEGLDLSSLGLLRTLYESRDTVHIKNIAASGLGVLVALFISIGADPNEAESFFKGKENKVSLSDLFD